MGPGGAAKASELGKNIKDVSKAVDSSGIVKIASTIDETGKITKAVQEARINVAAALEAGATTTKDIAEVVKDSKIADAAGSAEKIIAEVKATAQDAGVAQELAKAKKAADVLRSLPTTANCFGAGTPLLIPGGSIPIEELRRGDRVLSRSEFDPDGAIEAKQIEEIFVRVGLIRCIQIGGQVVRTTDEHPFFVVGKGWVQASLLEVGDLCIGHDGEKTVVDGVEETRRIETLYNLRVADYHTYFVGCDEWGFSVWVHNADYLIVKEGEAFVIYKAENGGFEPLNSITYKTIDAAKQAIGPQAKVFDAPLVGLLPLGNLGEKAISGLPAFELRVAREVSSEGRLIVVAGDKNVAKALGMKANTAAAEFIALAENGGFVIAEGKRRGRQNKSRTGSTSFSLPLHIFVRKFLMLISKHWSWLLRPMQK